MNRMLHLLVSLFFLNENINSQIISGPMLGAVELRTAYIWCETANANPVSIEYWQTDEKIKISQKGNFIGKYNFYLNEFYLTGLEPGTAYEYQIIINKNQKPANAKGKFTTQELWNFRKPAPDFSFLSGSCSFMNERKYDRSGRSYGGDSSIYEIMAKENAALMLWLGDNWYYREVDYFSEWGHWYRASTDRKSPVIQNFLKKMSHYAIWDDHDFGPNNACNSYVFKNEAKKVFDAFWCNPAEIHDRTGTYTRFSYNDVDFFLMDGRSFRSSDELKDSIDGKPNTDKVMWGKEQMSWLKGELLNSNGSFKIIANGSPILNSYNKYDCMVHYVNEFNELIKFISEEKINGVLFFSGDRHHSEIVSKKLPGSYTTYDIVSSSLTSGIYKPNDYELSNPDLLKDLVVNENNYTRVSVTGKSKERKLKIEFVSTKGVVLKSWEISEGQLK